MPNHLLGSFRVILNTPNAIPIAAGTTKMKKLNTLSAVRERLVSEDSNRVSRMRNNMDKRKKSMDFTPRLSLIEFSSIGSFSITLA